MLQALDPRSILLLAAVAGLAASVLMARDGPTGSERRLASSWGVWQMTTLAQAAACLGQALRGDQPPAVTYSLVNALQLLAIGLLWLGARRMLGHRAPLWLALPLPALWLAASLLPAFAVSQDVRIALFAPLSLGVMAMASRDLLRLHRREGLRAALDLGLVVGLMAAGLVALYAEVMLLPPAREAGWGMGGTGAAFIVALFGVMLPFLILAIHREQERAAQEKRRAEALVAGRAEVERLHDGLPAVIFLRDVLPDGSSRLRYRGGDFERVMGWPTEPYGTVDGRLAACVLDGWTLEEHLRTALRDGTARSEWQLRQPDGSLRHIQSEARVLGPLPGGATEVVGYARDVTQERLAAARGMAATRLASLGEMAAGLAHEVKQPLQSLTLGAELALLALARGEDEVVRGKLGTVLDEADRAADIIEHVRRFARGTLEDARPVPLALAGVVDGALRLARFGLEEEGVEVELSLGTPPLRVLGVSVLLERVLVALLHNAREALASLPAGAPRRLSIAVEWRPGGLVALSVADNGPGIAPEILPRLFEPFATTKGPDRGRGLDLAAAHGLLRSLGGTLSGANGAVGATFTLMLPAAD